MGQKSFLQKSTPFNSIRIKWVFVNKYLEKEAMDTRVSKRELAEKIINYYEV